ncbi:hypothetical protein BVC80_335g15 [Macleaya cordata]|uniref:Transposase-associated domain-containing protein n=1 Tax=Macleaya cordata TaxID=56857 RepID=A0A200QCE6_MACCD|nr:hypothetical protein BVC80_335g15 [Macleaya cordata]
MPFEIDKEWMKESNQRSARYLEGVDKFINFVVENGGTKTRFLCPCKICRNGKGQISLVNIRYHLYSSGIDQSYTEWCFHGETLSEKGKQQPARSGTINNIDEPNHPRMEQLVDDACRFHHCEAIDPLADPITRDNDGEHSKCKRAFVPFMSKRKDNIVCYCETE